MADDSKVIRAIITDMLRDFGVKEIVEAATGTQHEHVVDAVEAGVSDYLLKPFDPAVLREKLGKYCCPKQVS